MMKRTIFLGLLALGLFQSSWAQTTNEQAKLRQIKRHMTAANVALNRDQDTLKAIQEYRAALKLNPNLTTAKNMLNDILPKWNAAHPAGESRQNETKPVKTNNEQQTSNTTPNTPATPAKTQTTTTQADTVASQANTTTTTPEKQPAKPNGGRNPFANVNRNNENRTQNSGTTTTTATTTTTTTTTTSNSPFRNPFGGQRQNGNSQTSAATTPLTYFPDKDDVLKAFTKQVPQNTPVFRFYRTPDAPLNELLSTTDITVKTDEKPYGKWMSMNGCHVQGFGQTLALLFNSTNNKVTVIDQQSDIVRRLKDCDIKVSTGTPADALSDQMTIEVTGEYTASSYNDLMAIFSKVLLPTFGPYLVDNYEMCRWMKKGTIAYDTLYKQVPVVSEDADPFDEDLTSEPIMQTVIDTITSHVVRDESFPLTISLRWDLNCRKTALYGQCRLQMKYKSGIKKQTIALVDLSTPCTFYKLPTTYTAPSSSELLKPLALSSADSTDLLPLAKTNVKDKNQYNNWGYCKLNGIGTAQNATEAKDNFEEALRKNSPDAAANLFLLYTEGLGTEPDFEEALRCLFLGRDLKSAEAWNYSAELLAHAYAPDAKQAYNWFKGASKGSSEALLNQYNMLWEGIGCEANKKEAKDELMKCASNIKAGYVLAKMSLAEKAFSEAYSFAVESAQRGCTQSMQLLAELYFSGIGVRRDVRKATMWYNQILKTIPQQRKGYKYEKKTNR